MKKIVQLVFGFLFLFLCTGCAETGRKFWNRLEPGCTRPGVYVGGSLLDPIPRSALPPDPVRGSVTVIVDPFTGYSRYHSQGTYNSAYKTFDPYTGQTSISAEQSTWSNTSESVTPVYPYYYGTTSVPYRYPTTRSYGRGPVWRSVR